MTSATYTNIPIGPGITDLVDVALHPTRDGGAGNPLLIYRHSGGGTSGDKSELWRGVQPEMTALADYLLSPARAVHFDIASIETPQQSFDPTYMPRGVCTRFPEIVSGAQRLIRNARMVLKDYGCDPSLVGLIGASHGSWLWTMSMLMQPELGGSGVRMERRRRFETRGYNSRVKAIVNWQMPYPDFTKRASSTGITFTGAAVVGNLVTLAGAFLRYRYTANDQCVLTTGSPGTYTIAARISNDQIQLSTSPGNATANGYVSTDQTDLSWAHMLFGTRTAAEWDALPASLKEAVSPLKWAEANQLAYAVPTYFVSLNDGVHGNGVHPYGNTYDPNTDIHDWHGASDLSAALAAKGKSSTFQQYTSITPWNDGTIPAQLYNWLVARMNDQ